MESKKKFKPNPTLKLMDQVQEVLRYYHYAYRTEQTYCDWIKRYLNFYGMKPSGNGCIGGGNLFELSGDEKEGCGEYTASGVEGKGADPIITSF